MFFNFEIFLVFILSLVVSGIFNYKYSKYLKISLKSGFTGQQIAELMLKNYCINDVAVICSKVSLSDHYNPSNKTVNLSENVYYGSSLSAVAVAAHECGHALQHARGYAFLSLRSKLVPMVSFVSQFMSVIIFGGFIMMNIFPAILKVGIYMFALTTLFTIITLPVEFDASRRALDWLDGYRIVDAKEHSKAKDALFWAAMTYIVAALGSVMQLMRLINISSRRRDE